MTVEMVYVEVMIVAGKRMLHSQYVSNVRSKMSTKISRTKLTQSACVVKKVHAKNTSQGSQCQRTEQKLIVIKQAR